MSDEYIRIFIVQRSFKHLFDWRPSTLVNNEARGHAWQIAQHKHEQLNDATVHQNRR